MMLYVWLLLLIIFIAVLQKELDKIERNAKAVSEHASMTNNSLFQQVKVLCAL